MSRLDLLWTIKFQNEKHEVETVSTISRLLLENILPKHVAEIIIKENMSQVKRSYGRVVSAGTDLLGPLSRELR